MPNVGFAPKAIGKAFGLKAGETSEPFVVDNGVMIMKTIAITEAPEIADYTAYKNTLKQSADNRTSFEISSAIKEFADIEDERYKFY